MSGGSNASDGGLPATSGSEALENAVEKSRREYDKKVDTMEEIDDKAMRSVRTAVIVVGLVVSAVSVSGPSAVGELALCPVLVGTSGVVALSVSLLYGIGAYTVTQYPTGIGSTHREAVIREAYGNSEWLVRMIVEYQKWSDEITEEIRQTRRYLDTAQLSLSLGVVALLVSASTIVAKSAYGVRPLVTVGAVLSFLFVVRTYLGYEDWLSDMAKSRGTDYEFEPARIRKGTPRVRAFFAKFGITSARYDRRQEESDEA